MTQRRTALTAAVAATALLVTACSGGTDDGTPPPDGATTTASPSPTPAPVADETRTTAPDAAGEETDDPEDTGSDAAATSEAGGTDDGDSDTDDGTAEGPIREVDFGELEWTDTHTGTTVTLRDGEGEVRPEDPVTVVLTGDPAYTDLDGDGDEDALVTLTGDPDGTEWWSHTYAWLWDEEAGAATQVWPALTDDVRCGNVTQDIEAEDGTITVTFLDRRAGGEPCAEEPTVESTRVVELSGTWAYQVEPFRSALGECGEVASALLTPAEAQLPGAGLHGAPDEEVPLVASWDEIDRVALPDEAMRDWGLPPGWTRVMYTAPGQDPGVLTQQCGFVLTS